MTDIWNDKRRLYVIFTIAALASLGPLSIDTYLPAFPLVQQDLGASSGAVAATLATFFTGLCLGQFIYGPISDRIGRRTPLLAGLAVYILASIGCAFAPNIETLLVLRFVQALGSCAGMVVGRALIRDLFTPQETAQVFSLVMLCMGLAPVLAPLIGQVISANVGWRAIFALCAVFAAVVMKAASAVVPATQKTTPYIGGRFWRTLRELLQHRGFLGYALTGALIQAGLFAYITGSPNFFMEHLGFTSRQYTMFFAMNAIGLIGASQLNTWLLRTRSYAKVLHLVIPISTGAAVLLASRIEIGLPTWVSIVCLFVFVASLGLVFPNSTAGALAEQSERAGSASALLGLIQYGGAALASAVVGKLHSLTDHSMELVILGCALSSVFVLKTLLED